MHEKSPGPVYGLPNLTGTENLDPSSKYPRAPAFSLSPRREGNSLPDGPGPTLHPGDHIYRTGKDTGRTIIIRGKVDDFKTNSNPAPGQYDPQHAENATKPKKLEFSFGKKGAEPKLDSLPGPGEYEVARTGQVKTFTIGGRPQNEPLSDTPGPGDYSLNPKVYRQGPEGSKGFTMHGRSESSQGTLTPGPGSYEYDRAFDKTRKRIPVPGFGGKAKDPNVDYVPGPGSYSPSWGNDARGFKLRGRDSDPKMFETPGPGEYVIDGKIFSNGRDTGRKVTITGRPKDLAHSDVPGPGAYSPESPRRGNPAFSLGERKEYKLGDDTPGPGSYNPNERRTPNGFMMRGRPNEAKGSYTPGPGEYNIPDHLSNRGRVGPNGYMIRGRKNSLIKSDVPGPGSYSPEASPRDKTKGPAWSFGDKPNIAGGNTNPGPGYYDPNDGKPVKGFKIHQGGNGRGFATGSDAPAPNQYNVDSNIANKIGKRTPAFSMKGRDGDVGPRNDVPGPGSYTPDLNSDKYRGPVATFKGRPKDLDINSNPGPGQYDPDPMIGKTVRSTKPTLPVYSLGAKYRDID